jgi:hypothetical protein
VGMGSDWNIFRRLHWRIQSPGWGIQGSRITLCFGKLSSKTQTGGLRPLFKYYDINLGFTESAFRAIFPIFLLRGRRIPSIVFD